MSFKKEGTVSYKPFQFYKIAEKKVKDAVGIIRVYFRNADGSLGRIDASDDYPHKDAIFSVKEQLVAGGDDIHKRAVLAVLDGGKNV